MRDAARGRVLLLLLASVCTGVGASLSPEVRGVDPADLQRYNAPEFECVVGGQRIPLVRDHLNDEYCDCDDGADEPGTAACSHLLQSEFYCDNDGFFPEKIHTSHVDDGICDCCDGSDEAVSDGSSPCANTCSVKAESFRLEAQTRLEAVTAGFEKREATLKSEVAAFFSSESDAQRSTAKVLEALVLLKERVVVHKEREELRERKYRLELARQRQSEGQSDDKSVEESSMEYSDAVEKEAIEAVAFEGLDAVSVSDDDAPIAAAQDEHASEVLDACNQRVKTLIELPDTSRVSLAEYLRMNHNKAATSTKRVRRTAEQMRREDFLGPLFNGDAEGRKKIGVYALRTLGLLASPVRALVELVLFVPTTIWDVLSTPSIAGRWIENLPAFPSPVRLVWFRQLGGGSVYRAYSSASWGVRVMWDAPVFVYQYMFPKLDEEAMLPVAESLRNVLKEIEADISQLEQQQEDKRKAENMDYGPDRAFFALKDKCIEKRIEKYEYKFCAFNEIKQDRTNLGKWETWGFDDVSSAASDDQQTTVDYSKMRFTQGKKCFNGPNRSVVVSLECGEEDEILGVEEPSTCVYEMKVRSPLACTSQVLAKAQEDVAFWTRKQ